MQQYLLKFIVTHCLLKCSLKKVTKIKVEPPQGELIMTYATCLLINLSAFEFYYLLEQMKWYYILLKFQKEVFEFGNSVEYISNTVWHTPFGDKFGC